MNKRNWQTETDKIINSLNGEKPTLLLHSCCAPCSSASLEYLTEYFNIDMFFYNPNISSIEEFTKRLSELERFIKEAPFTNGIRVIAPEYNHNEFLLASKGLEYSPEGGARCKNCFKLRLSKTAEEADRLGYKYFATTLTISPLKNAEIINCCGIALAENKKTVYLPTDLKKKERYKRSIELSNQFGLYRQNFCGCEFSQSKGI